MVVVMVEFSCPSHLNKAFQSFRATICFRRRTSQVYIVCMCKQEERTIFQSKMIVFGPKIVFIVGKMPWIQSREIIFKTKKNIDFIKQLLITSDSGKIWRHGLHTNRASLPFKYKNQKRVVDQFKLASEQPIRMVKCCFKTKPTYSNVCAV